MKMINRFSDTQFIAITLCYCLAFTLNSQAQNLKEGIQNTAQISTINKTLKRVQEDLKNFTAKVINDLITEMACYYAIDFQSSSVNRASLNS